MNNAVVVKVGYGGEGCADEVCSVAFVVASFSAYSVEEFPTKGEVGDEVDYERLVRTWSENRSGLTVVHGFEVIHKREDVLVTH